MSHAPRLAIITAIFGDYEELKPPVPQLGVDVDWVCVTDRARPYTGWRLVVEPGDDNPVISAKRPKCLPWEYTDAEQSIWLDASFRVTNPTVGRFLRVLAAPIAQFNHPDRDCIYDEATVSAAMQRYAHLPISEQMAAYRADGHPKRWGLWAAGVIARTHTPEVRRMGAAWLAQCHHWGQQDQLSEAYCLREAGIRPVTIPGGIYDNAWFKFEPSERHVRERR